MQTLLLDEKSSTMTQQPIDMLMLSRVDSDQKATASRVDDLDKSLQGLARDVSEINGKLTSPWWLAHVIGPLCVASAVGTVAAVIILLVKVNGIETFIRNNGGVLASLRLEKINPDDPQNALEAKQIVAQAKKAKIKIPPDVIEQAGDKFVEASNRTPQAWDTALQLAAYQRWLNAKTIGPLQNVRPLPPSFHPTILMRIEESSGPNSQRPLESWLAGNAPPETAATIEPFTGQLMQPSQVTSGAQFIIIDWKRPDISFVLTNIHLKNVIIRNAEIRYSGITPLWLENVYFVDCTFDVIPEESRRGQDFAKALLTPTSVTFRGL